MSKGTKLAARKSPWFASCIVAGLLACWPAGAALAQDLPPLDQDELLIQVQNNAEVVAAKEKWEAAKQRVPQSQALDDPMVGVGLINVPTSGSFRSEDMTMKELSLSQRLPFPGKRGLRGEVAGKEADAAEAGITERSNRLGKEVKLVFQDLSHVYRSTEVTQRNKEILESYAKIAEVRYQVGQTIQFDLVKAQAAATKMLDDLIMLQQQKKALEARLNALLNEPTGKPLGRPKDPQPQALPLSLEELQQAALESNPTLAAMRHMTQSKEKGHALAQFDYLPDFNIRGAYGQRERTLDGDKRKNMMTGMLEMSLPLYFLDKQAPKTAEAKADLKTATAQYETMRHELMYMVAETTAMADRQWRQIKLYKTGILPQVSMQVSSAMSAYTVNKADFMTLLDSRMELYRAELSYHQAVTEYQKALANLEFLVGKKLF